jgi:outer membrane protein OmpA-like peptidoglycan-associated protein
MTAHRPLTAALAATLALAACAPADYSDPTRDRTREGAISGALVGGIIGYARGDDDNRLASTILGAGVGAVAGGAIGSALDRQAAELRASLGNPDVGIVNTGSALVVTMPQDILFDVDSTAIRPALRTDLMTVARHLQLYPDSMVSVVGHTDSTGSALYNQTLSERRALAVMTVLRDGGVPSARLVATGRGEDEPIASNLTDAGRALNRRVEIVIRPNGA